MTTNMNIALEAPDLASNETYLDSPRDHILSALARAVGGLDNLDEVDLVVTGLDEDATGFIESICDEYDIEFECFIPLAKAVVNNMTSDEKEEFENDGQLWTEAKRRARDWRANKYADQDGKAIDLAVVVDDGSYDSGEFIDRMRHRGIDTMTYSVKRLIDWEALYDDREAAASKASAR